MINKNNQHISTFQTSNNNRFQCKSGGGSRHGVSASSLANTVSSGLTKGYPMYNTSSTCGSTSRPSNLGAAKIRGGGKPYSSFNNLRSSAYGYTSAGAAMAKPFRGSYAPPSEIRRAQCGGKRRTKRRQKSKRRKSRRRKATRKRRKSRKRKSRRKRRKSRKRKSRRKRRKSRRGGKKYKQKGGNRWSQAGSNQALGYRYSSPNFNEPTPWVLGGPGSKVVTPLTR